MNSNGIHLREWFSNIPINRLLKKNKTYFGGGEALHYLLSECHWGE